MFQPPKGTIWMIKPSRILGGIHHPETSAEPWDICQGSEKKNDYPMLILAHQGNCVLNKVTSENITG